MYETFLAETRLIGNKKNYEPLGSNPTEQKKEKAMLTFSFGVPYGIRTHDIQNHNLTL